MRTRKAPRQIERAEQEALVEWFKLAHPEHILFAIPNGLVRNVSQAASSVRGGLVKGMPDLMLAVGNKTYHGLFIELKRPSYWGVTAGTLSIEQKDMIKRLNDAGYLAIACWGWIEAQKAIIDYMGLEEEDSR